MASPTGRPSRQPPSPPDPVLQQRAWTAAAMGALSLGGLFLASGLRHAIYVIAGTLVIGAVAAWLGKSAMFRTQLSTYWTCTSGANTLTAQQACQHQLSQTITNEFGAFEPTGSGGS